MRPATIALALIAAAGFTQVAYPQAFTSSLSAPVSQADLQAAAASNLATMAATTPQFVGGSSAYQPLASLLTTYPCATNTLGMLAHVNDAWGGASTTLVCESSGSSFYWRPQRTDYAATITQTSGTVTLTPLASAPIVYLSSTPTGTVTIALGTANVWPGASFHIYAPATIGVSGITISNLVGGGTVPLLQGSDKIVTWTGSAWKSN